MNISTSAIISHGPFVLEHHLNFSGLHGLHSLENEPTGAAGNEDTAEVNRDKLGTDGLSALMEAHHQQPRSSVHLLYTVPPRVRQFIESLCREPSQAAGILEEERASIDTSELTAFG